MVVFRPVPRRGKNGERASGVGWVAGFGAFGADGSGGAGFVVGGAVVWVAGRVLGADYDDGNYAVLPERGAGGFLAALRGNGARGSAWRDCGELLRVADAGIRCQRVRSWVAFRRCVPGSKRVSVWWRDAGDCDVGTAVGPCMASRLSSVRRGVDRNWGGADPDGGVAREGSHGTSEKVNSSFVPREDAVAKKNPCMA